MRHRTLSRSLFVAATFLMFFSPAAEVGKPPAVGDTAQDFQLKALNGEEIKLSKFATDGPVVLVVLRGYPGYQCPLCTAQVGAFLGHSADFKAAGAKVLFVYPGPSAQLDKHAADFVKDKTLADPFYMVIDPDFVFTNAYNLRWDSPHETAYPSTFILTKERKITFAKTSTVHGGRADANEVLAALKAIK